MLQQFLKLFGFTLAIYLINLAAAQVGVYQAWPYFDIPMHLLGGASIAVMMLVAWDMGLGYGKGSLSSIPLLVKALTVIGFVAIIGIVWEWHEFIHDFILTMRGLPFIPAQPSIGDTMKDLFNDLVGGSVAFGLSLMCKKKKK